MLALTCSLAAQAQTQSHGKVYYYYTDALHSAVVETDAAGTVLERTYYAPFGSVLNRSLRNGPGYTGHEEDAATGGGPGALRRAARAVLADGEVAAKGIRGTHAEVNGVNAARDMGLTPTGAAASRSICPSCAQFLQQNGVAPLSPLKHDD